MGIFRGREAHSRSFAKAVSWRVTGTIDTFVISLIVTGKLTFGGLYRTHGTIHQDNAVLLSRADLGCDLLGSSRAAAVPANLIACVRCSVGGPRFPPDGAARC